MPEVFRFENGQWEVMADATGTLWERAPEQDVFVGQLRYREGRWEMLTEKDPKNDPGRFQWLDIRVHPDAAALVPPLDEYDDLSYGERGARFYHVRGGGTGEENWVSEKDVFGVAEERLTEEEQTARIWESGAEDTHEAAYDPKTNSYVAQRRKEVKPEAQASSVGALIAQAVARGDMKEARRLQEFEKGPSEPSLTAGEAAFARQTERQRERSLSGGPQAAPPRSLDEMIAEALAVGDYDKALYFDAFQRRPSRIQALAFAMDHAESPEEFDALLALAEGPALAFGASQPAPVFPPAFSPEAQRFQESFLGQGQVPGPTTEQARADAVRFAQTQAGAPFNLSQEQIATFVGSQAAAQAFPTVAPTDPYPTAPPPGAPQEVQEAYQEEVAKWQDRQRQRREAVAHGERIGQALEPEMEAALAEEAVIARERTAELAAEFKTRTGRDPTDQEMETLTGIAGTVRDPAAQEELVNQFLAFTGGFTPPAETPLFAQGAINVKQQSDEELAQSKLEEALTEERAKERLAGLGWGEKFAKPGEPGILIFGAGSQPGLDALKEARQGLKPGSIARNRRAREFRDKLDAFAPEGSGPERTALEQWARDQGIWDPVGSTGPKQPAPLFPTARPKVPASIFQRKKQPSRPVFGQPFAVAPRR